MVVCLVSTPLYCKWHPLTFIVVSFAIFTETLWEGATHNRLYLFDFIDKYTPPIPPIVVQTRFIQKQIKEVNKEWHIHRNYLWNPHAHWGDSPGRLICPWPKPWKKSLNTCQKSWTAKKFARHAGTDRNVQTVSSISKPKFIMKLKNGDISA